MPEHFCTLFDHHFLPQSLALYESLQRHAPGSCLWVLCLDQQVQLQLAQLALPNLATISLLDVETAHPELLQARSNRNWREYCWTLSPFIHQAVLDRQPQALRVTYLDADLYFFASPSILLAELDQAGKHVLITEHAYDPRHDLTVTNGRFCVQFVTFDRSQAARQVMLWWRERCLEWCYERCETDRFGDQKYLDQWPRLFGSAVHIVTQVQHTLAPWNIEYFHRQARGKIEPVFYHFHGLRMINPGKIHLVDDYRIPSSGRRLYQQYLQALARARDLMAQHGMPLPVLPPRRMPTWKQRMKARLKRWLGQGGGLEYARLPAILGKL